MKSLEIRKHLLRIVAIVPPGPRSDEIFHLDIDSLMKFNWGMGIKEVCSNQISKKSVHVNI